MTYPTFNSDDFPEAGEPSCVSYRVALTQEPPCHPTCTPTAEVEIRYAHDWVPVCVIFADRAVAAGATMRPLGLQRNRRVSVAP